MIEKLKENKDKYFILIALFMHFVFYEFLMILGHFNIDISFLADNGLIGGLKVLSYLILLIFHPKKVNYNAFGTILFFAFVVYSILVFPINMPYISEVLDDIVVYVLPVLLIISYTNDSGKLLKYLRITMYPLAIIAIAIPFTDVYNISVNYMELTYSTIVAWTTITYFSFTQKKIIDICLSVVLASIYLIYGTRYSIVVISIFLMICLIKYTRRYTKLFLIPAVFIISITLILNFEGFLSFIYNLTGYFGISSRNISRIMYGDFITTTGRENEWGVIINSILDNPLGLGLGADRVLLFGSYAHNIILELYVTLGIFLGSIVIIYLGYISIRFLFISSDNDYSVLFLILIVPNLVILFVSRSVFTEYAFYAAFYLFKKFELERIKSRRV